MTLEQLETVERLAVGFVWLALVPAYALVRHRESSSAR
jgi:hypothetical protein